MERIFSAEEMKACDAYTIETLGVPSCALMERAAAACADEVIRILSERKADLSKARVLVLCGSGNNGGDGYACARLLALRGVRTELFSAGNPDHRTHETKRQAEICGRMGIPEAAEPDFSNVTIVVDALFGVGLSRPVEGRYAVLVEAVNACGVPVVAVDIPSGISADTGQVLGCAIHARSTVTMQRAKPGLVLYPGASYAGRVIRADIGVSTAASDCETYALSRSDAEELLPKRRPDGNKGTFGKILLIAGSYNMAGASYLSALAALRTGCGMVRILTVDENREILQRLLPEAMLSTYKNTAEALRGLDMWRFWADVIACGPGLGTSDTAEALVKEVLAGASVPVVCDADALNILSGDIALLDGHKNIYLTPHIGEMSRLTGQSSAELKADPLAAARSFAAEHNCTVLMKDARTVIASPSGTAFINTTGNSGMSTAGSGDVLTGILAALLAQGADPVTAGALASYVHGACGDAAAERLGERYMKAGDIIEELQGVLR